MERFFINLNFVIFKSKYKRYWADVKDFFFSLNSAQLNNRIIKFNKDKILLNENDENYKVFNIFIKCYSAYHNKEYNETDNVLLNTALIKLTGTKLTNITKFKKKILGLTQNYIDLVDYTTVYKILSMYDDSDTSYKVIIENIFKKNNENIIIETSAKLKETDKSAIESLNLSVASLKLSNKSILTKVDNREKFKNQSEKKLKFALNSFNIDVISMRIFETMYNILENANMFNAILVLFERYGNVFLPKYDKFISNFIQYQIADDRKTIKVYENILIYALLNGAKTNDYHDDLLSWCMDNKFSINSIETILSQKESISERNLYKLKNMYPKNFVEIINKYLFNYLLKLDKNRYLKLAYDIYRGDNNINAQRNSSFIMNDVMTLDDDIIKKKIQEGDENDIQDLIDVFIKENTTADKNNAKVEFEDDDDAEDPSKSGDINEKYIFDNGYDINKSDIYGVRPIHTFAVDKSLDLSSINKNVLDKIVFVVRDISGRTPLFYAVLYSNISFIKKYGQIYSYDRKAFNMSVKLGDIEVFNSLFDVFGLDLIDQNMLHVASKYNSPNLVYILSKVIDIDIIDIEGSTPLHIASLYGNEQVVKKLLENGASIDPVDNLSRTPLFIAVEHNKLKCVELLIKYDANVNIDGYFLIKNYRLSKSTNKLMRLFNEEIEDQYKRTTILEMAEIMGNTNIIDQIQSASG